MEQLVTQFLSQQTGNTAVWIGVISVIIFAIVKIKKAVSAIWPFVKKLVTVVEDLFGAEARPGVEARPGLMARMKTSEENDVQITATQNQIKTTLAEHSKALLELQPNHGGSMKDVLKATREELKALRNDLTTHIEEQRAATVNAEASAQDAVAAVVSAREAVVGAQTAVLAATERATAVNVHVTTP